MESNPSSTGGLGVNFETRVQAAFVALMLTEGSSPCLPPWRIKCIKLQGRHEGFHIDDLIVFTEDDASGQKAKLLAQIKHNISITKGNKEFGEVIYNAWKDFNDTAIFSPNNDAFAIITGPLSANDQKNVRIILEWARHSENEKEFIAKVSRNKFSNPVKKEKLDAFRHHLTEANDGKDISDYFLWSFLKRLYILNYDLDAETGCILSLIQALIARSTSENPVSIWEKILVETQSFNQNAGTISIETISEALRSSFELRKNTQWSSDFRKLKDHGKYIVEGIRSDIGGTRIKRTDLIAQLIDICEDREFVYVSGERGCGKSGLIWDFTEKLGPNVPIFCLRTEDFDAAHLDNIFTNMGLLCPLSEIEERFALIPRKYLFIESLEKLLELKNRGAFNDLIHFVQKHSGWRIIATGRDYAYQQITFNYIHPSNINFSSLVVNGFDDDQIDQLCEKLPSLKPLAEIASLRSLLRIPFYADLAHRVAIKVGDLATIVNEKNFRLAVWREVISNESFREEGLPLRRRKTFIEISVLRAKQMIYDVPESGFDSDAVLKLEEDGLVRRDSTSGRICPAHDVLEDMGLVHYIEDVFQQAPGKINDFLNKVGHEPAMNRAYRFWLLEKLRDGGNVKQIIMTILSDDSIEICWKDETITAVLSGNDPYGFLIDLKEQLFARDFSLLKRFCFILRISCKIPNQELYKRFVEQHEEKPTLLQGLFLLPHGNGWKATISFLYGQRECLSDELLPHIAALLDDWSYSIQIEGDYPEEAREAGLLALHCLNMMKHSGKDRDSVNKFLSVTIKVVPKIKDEFYELVKSSLSDANDTNRRPSFFSELITLSLLGMETMFLCKYVPDLVIKISWREWISDENDLKKSNFFYREELKDSFGLSKYGDKAHFFPPSGAKGPFCHLLNYHPRIALDFIIRLLNVATEKYAHSELASPNDSSSLLKLTTQDEIKRIEIVLNDGRKINQYGSERLWLGYRGSSVMPELLQSALMAFENWTISLVKQYGLIKETEWLFDYVLRNSNSVMPTAVLASIATGFPKELGRASLPILRTPELYDLDLKRYIDDLSHGGMNLFAASVGPFAEIYFNERQTSSQQPWRKQHLEHLIIQLQITELREEIFIILDELREKAPKDETWGFRFHRIDTRNWRPKFDEENRRIIFLPGELESELTEVQDKNEKEQTLNNRFFKIYLWSENALKNEEKRHEYFSDWKDVLGEVRELTAPLNARVSNQLKYGQSSIGTNFHGSIVKAASIILRDHSFEMENEDQELCKRLVFMSILTNADSEDPSIISNATDFYGSAASASILPILLDRAPNSSDKELIKRIIAVALTHVNDGVRESVATGIREYLWQKDPVYVQSCFVGSIEFAWLISDLRRSGKHFHSKSTLRSYSDDNKQKIRKTRIEKIRKRLAFGTVKSEHLDNEFDSYTFWYSVAPCLLIPNGSVTSDHVSFMSRIIKTIIDSESDENRCDKKDQDRLQINHDTLMKYCTRISEYLVHIEDANVQKQLIEIMAEGCGKAPNFISILMTHIRVSAINVGKGNRYWTYWNELSATIQKIAVDMAKVRPRYIRGDDRRQLIRTMLFMDSTWHHAPDEMVFISQGNESIFKFVTNAVQNPDVYEGMSRLMFYFPEIFLLPGLRILSKEQIESKKQEPITKNAAHHLEDCICQLLVYDDSSLLLDEHYQQCMALLNAIIETGSSRAYYLREQLVQTRRAWQ